MNLECIKCAASFAAAEFVGYCPSCVEQFRAAREAIRRKQRPAPGVCADGQFDDPENGPRTVQDPVSAREVCGLCGSDELEPGYGLGSGYGIGVYTFCCGCNTFLNFSPDGDE